MGAFVAGEVVNSIWHIGGETSLPAIKGIVASTPPGEFRSHALQIVFDPQILPVLRSELSVPQEGVRASAASALAQRGDSSGLEIAAEIAADPKQQVRSRISALDAFQWFRGPAIERFLLNVARASRAEQAEVHAAACSALRWYDDLEVVSFLVTQLDDQSSSVRQAALNSLVFRGSEHAQQLLKDKLSTLEPVRKVYAAVALQRMRTGIYPDIFRNFLKNKADQSKDYAATVQAIGGLHEAYLRAPVSAAVEALRDERREVRLAATLALAEHEEVEKVRAALANAAVDKDPHFRLAASRAFWALTVVQKAEKHRAEAALALTEGNFRRAEHILSQVYRGGYSRGGSAGDYRAVLENTLSVSKPMETPSRPNVIVFSGPNYVFQDDFNPAIAGFNKLESEIRAKKGEASEAIDELQDPLIENPGLQKSFREDPNLESLRNIYEFRVLTGIQEPTTIEHIKLPAVEVPKPK